VSVGVLVGVFVDWTGVFVGVLVDVLVGGTGVFVGVLVDVLVGGTEVFVGVSVGVFVGGTDVLVGVSVGVLVGCTGVFVGVSVGVFVGGTDVLVGVSVGVLVGVSIRSKLSLPALRTSTSGLRLTVAPEPSRTSLLETAADVSRGAEAAAVPVSHEPIPTAKSTIMDNNLVRKKRFFTACSS